MARAICQRWRMEAAEPCTAGRSRRKETGRRGRTGWAAPLAVVVLAAVALPAAAQQKQHFDIPAQGAEGALRALALQSGRRIVFPYSAVAGRRAPALVGDFEIGEAAARLARSLGLVVRELDARTISLAASPARSAPAAAEAPRSTAAAAPDPPVTLREVVVTATLRPETVNAAPLAVSAFTQRSLDERGVKRLDELETAAPSLDVASPNGFGLAYPSLRGVVSAGLGVAATTGVYLDDTPLQKRNAGGGSNTGYTNGTPLPPLFDMERVEVLRGPQGTLFGSGSQGGSIRFITAGPSLTDRSAYGRADISTTADGGTSREAGFAFGGPLIRDRIGFRVTGWARRTAGWIDLVDRFTGREKLADANAADAEALRASLLWAPSERARVRASYALSRERASDVVANTTLPTEKPIVEPTQCYDNRAVTSLSPVAYPEPVGIGDAACATLSAAGVATFTRPGATYGPFRLGRDDRIGQPDFTWPSTTNLSIASVSVDYDFHGLTAKSVTSYVRDGTNQRGGSGTYVSTSRNANAAYGDILIARGLDFVATCRDACLAASHIDTLNRRWGFTQEIRLASAPDARPASWLAGVFYSHQRLKQQQYATITDDQGLRVFGLTTEQRFGVPPFRTPAGSLDGYTFLNNAFNDEEMALFGEANLRVGDRLRLTAGLRLSRFVLDFRQVGFGPASGFLVPAQENGGLSDGRAVETPLTPRFSAQYRLNARDTVYATVAKGFRAGGANPPLPQGLCGPVLDAYGLRAADVPATYGADAVWNYEIGGKARLFGVAQVNVAAYHIDWQDIQLPASLGTPCGIPFVRNSGSARIDGLELEAEVRITRNLAGELALARTNARYLDDTIALGPDLENPVSVPLISALAGQKLPVPPLTLNLALRYERRLGGLTTYVRGQYRYVRRLSRTSSTLFGASTYSPDRIDQDAQRVDLRTGVARGRVELSAYVMNLFDNRRGVITGGRQACATAAQGGDAACADFQRYVPDFRLASTYAPRQIGLQLVFRD